MNFDRLRRGIDPERLRRIGHAVDLESVRRLARRLAPESLRRFSQRLDSTFLHQKPSRTRRQAAPEHPGVPPENLHRRLDLERLRRGVDLERLRRGVDLQRLRQVGDDFDWDRVGLGDPVTRRRLLQALPGAIGVAVLAGGALEAPAHTPRATTKPRAAHHPVEKATVRPAVVQRRPVYTLHEYRRVVPGPAFPADAVALTIDDGPHPIWTPKILDLLDKYHVPALFCMIGNQVLGHEHVARSVIHAGHQLANHTWSHPSTLARKPAASVHKEISRAQEKIHNTTGYTPRLFRSPGGAWSATVLHETAKSGLVPLDWSDDPRDWTKPGTAAITHRMLACRPGQIILCHDGGGDRSQTYAALRKVIPALTARGYRFVAL